MSFEITIEKVLDFRAKLREEMMGDQLWYHPSKEKNQDVYVFHRECPYATSKAGKVAEHRYVWWLNHPNEPIEYNEMIHHINGNHKDNRIENLEKIKMKQHGLRHKAMRENERISISAIQEGD
jgi:hypothetical protein